MTPQVPRVAVRHSWIIEGNAKANFKIIVISFKFICFDETIREWGLICSPESVGTQVRCVEHNVFREVVLSATRPPSHQYLQNVSNAQYAARGSKHHGVISTHCCEAESTIKSMT